VDSRLPAEFWLFRDRLESTEDAASLRLRVLVYRVQRTMCGHSLTTCCISSKNTLLSHDKKFMHTRILTVKEQSYKKCNLSMNKLSSLMN
jgi:hypothetical protein